MKGLRALLLAGLILLPGAGGSGARASDGAAAVPAARSSQAGPRRREVAPLRFTEHARRRMEERGVSEREVRAAVEEGETFRYWHAGKWKTGYYEPDKRLFIAADGPVVITVITGASRRYVEGLKRKKP